MGGRVLRLRRRAGAGRADPRRQGARVLLGEKIALGYGFAAIVCLAFALLRAPLRELDPTDPEDVPGAAFEGGAEEIDPTPAVNGRRAPEPVGV